MSKINKNSKEYYLEHVRRDILPQNAYGGGVEPFFDYRNRVPTSRNYAKGRQEIVRFKNAKLNKADGATKDMIDLFNKIESKIDWTPESILAPKINVATSVISQRERTFYTKAIDRQSVKQKKDREYLLRGAMLASQSGATDLPVQAPMDEEQLQKMVNETTEPLETQFKSAIEYVLYTQNNYFIDVEQACATNLIVDGMCVMKIEIDENYNLRLRVCDVVNMYFAIPDKKTFDDCYYFSERIWLTIDELKVYDRNKEYKDGDFDVLPRKNFNGIDKYAVIDIEFKDTEMVEGVELQVWRKCKVVENTSLVLDYGVVDFQARGLGAKGEYAKAYSSFIAYCPYVQNTEKSIISLVERVIPNVDSYYITNINKQFEKANAPTRTTSFSIQALSQAASLFKTSPQEMLLYQRAFGITFKNDSMPGAQGTESTTTEGGVSNNYNIYLTDEQVELRKIQDIMGIPAGLDSSLPDPNQPVYSTKLAVGGAANALALLAEGLNFMFYATINRLACKIKYLVVADKLQMIQSVYADFFDDIQEEVIMEDFVKREVDFTFVTMPNQEAMQNIMNALDLALQSGQILITDKIQIMLESGNNLELANKLLEKRINEKILQEQEAQQKNAAAAAEANAAAAKEANEKELEKIRLKGEFDLKLQEMKLQSELSSGKTIIRTPSLLENSYAVSTANYMQTQFDVVVSDKPDKLGQYLGEPNIPQEFSKTGQRKDGRLFVFIVVTEDTALLINKEAFILAMLMRSPMNGYISNFTMPTPENYEDYAKIGAELSKMITEIVNNYMKEEVIE